MPRIRPFYIEDFRPEAPLHRIPRKARIIFRDRFKTLTWANLHPDRATIFLKTGVGFENRNCMGVYLFHDAPPELVRWIGEPKNLRLGLYFMLGLPNVGPTNFYQLHFGIVWENQTNRYNSNIYFFNPTKAWYYLDETGSNVKFATRPLSHTDSVGRGWVWNHLGLGVNLEKGEYLWCIVNETKYSLAGKKTQPVSPIEPYPNVHIALKPGGRAASPKTLYFADIILTENEP